MPPMRAPGPRLGAILAVLTSAAVGAVTNLITNRWGWTLAALPVLLTMSAALAAQAAAAGRGDGTRVRQIATGGSRIHGSGIHASGGATVTQTASRKGALIDSPIDAHGADVTQTAAHAEITGSPIEATGD